MKRMKHLDPRDYLVYIMLILLFTGIALLIFFLLYGEAERNKLLLEFEAERTAAFFIESILRNYASGDVEMDDRVIGFGVYETNGENIRIWGDAPEKLNPDVIEKNLRHVIYNTKKKSLTIIRRIGRRPPHESQEMTDHMRRMMRGQPPHFPALIYFEFDASSYMHKYGLNRITRLGIPVFLFIMIVTLLLYKKNIEYRKKLVSQAQLARLGEMARTLSHEIKNPLGAMRIQTGYLKKTLPEEKQADLLLIEEEIERLTLLTRRISDFVRDPAGKPENITLHTFITGLLKRYDHPITFRDETGTDVAVLFDRDRLRSVLENVIMNAVESNEETDTNERPHVAIHLSKVKHGLLLSILDRGKGIQTDSMEHLFDPFYSTKTRGSGMGLAIARRFCEAMGAEITLIPREGGGTEVKILFTKKG
jgi:two-component system sensor histidine kinase HydH